MLFERIIRKFFIVLILFDVLVFKVSKFLLLLNINLGKCRIYFLLFK